jgi:hypothetical protein
MPCPFNANLPSLEFQLGGLTGLLGPPPLHYKRTTALLTGSRAILEWTCSIRPVELTWGLAR